MSDLTFKEYQETAITDVYFKTTDLINSLVKDLALNDIQREQVKTLIHVSQIEFLSLGLAEESGEVAGKIKKIIRNNNCNFTVENINELSKELGDVLWYLTALIKELRLTLGEVAFQNILKLKARKQNGTIIGTGDNR